MSGAGSTSSQLFQATQIQAPAAVLLRQLQKLDADESLPVLASLLQNPALFARVLELQSKATKSPLALQQRLDQLEPVWLMRMLRNSALQQCMQNDQLDSGFVNQHWQLSRYVALVATELASACKYQQADVIACSAVLLRMGMLVLQQQHGQAYSALVLAHTDQAALLRAEHAAFGIDHIIAGERLLDAWQLEPFCIDAMRYQARSAAAIMDAAPLVRICWFANYLVNNAQADTPEIAALAGTLFALSPSAIHEMLGRVQVQYTLECAAYGMNVASGETPGQTACAQTDQLKQYLVSSTMLTALSAQTANTADSLKTVLINLLLEAGIAPTFMVFAQDQTSAAFHLVTSNNVYQNSDDLTFVCALGRNVVSEIITDGGFIISGGYASLADAALALTSRELTVIDRQLLDLLGGQTLLCEAVPVNATTRAALLLGIPFSNGKHYLAHTGIRQLIRRKIAAFMKREGDDELPLTTVVYRQRVREAVHEANNPLTIIKNYLQLLSIRQGEQAETRDDIKLIKSEIDRVARILIALRETKELDVKSQQININQLLEQMQLMFTSASGEGKNIAVTFDLAPINPRLWGKPDALKQILTNLVKNAAEAINNSGNIKVLTRGNVYFHNEIFVRLCVADDGPGIGPQVMPQLFTAGTSTKGPLNTGTGLAIVNKLVADMQGHISCQSDNSGTVFSILLPQVS